MQLESVNRRTVCKGDIMGLKAPPHCHFALHGASVHVDERIPRMMADKFTEAVEVMGLVGWSHKYDKGPLPVHTKDISNNEQHRLTNVC